MLAVVRCQSQFKSASHRSRKVAIASSDEPAYQNFVSCRQATSSRIQAALFWAATVEPSKKYILRYDINPIINLLSKN